MHRLVALLTGALIASALGLVTPALAQAESVEVSVGPSPTQDIPLNIVASGVASGGTHRLYVYVGRGTTCGAFPDFNGGSTVLAGGQALSAGAYEKTFSYTPTEVGTYTVCAYLDESEFGTPDAMANTSFTAQMPSAAVSIEVSPGATQELPITVTVSGETQVARKLYVYAGRGNTCGAFPDFNGGTTELAAGQAISAGTYSKTFTYTPKEIGNYVVCGYVDESEFSNPNASGTQDFNVQMPSAIMAVGVAPSATENTPVTVTVSGESEVARKLYVYAGRGSTCGAFPDFNGGTTELAAGQPVGSGAYSKTFTYTPTETGAYSVCGYVDESEFSSPNAVGQGSFTNVTPQSRAEEAHRAAQKREAETAEAREQAAHAAEAAAAARKLGEYLQGVAERGHCNQLSDEYAASIGTCEADEAAIRAAGEAEWNALELSDLAKPIGNLSVRAISRPGRSSQHPGSTVLRITTSPFAHITIKLRHYGHRTEHYEAWPASLHSRTGTLEPEYTWTCSRPGGRYTYVVTARTGVGRTLTRTGHFDPVSTARCHALERSEQEARERSARRYAEETRQAREAEEALQREGEFNCRQRGGTVVQLYVEGEPRLGCRAPNGGLLPWIS